MPLGRRLSRIFKPKQANDNITTSDNHQPTALDPVIPPTIFEEDEQAIITATTASLRDENARLEARHLEDASQIAHLNHLLFSRNAENKSLLENFQNSQRSINQLQESHSVKVSQLDERLQIISTQLQSLQEQKTGFERENTALQNDCRALHASNQEYQTWVGTARAQIAEQSRKIQNLEQQLAVALEPMDQASQHAYNDKLNLLHTREELEATFNARKVAMTQEIDDLKKCLMSKEQNNTNLNPSCWWSNQS